MATQEDIGSSFSILPLTISPLPSFPVAAVHEVRVRRNAPKIPTDNDSRSLFLKNIPADSTEPHFRAVFSQLVGPGRFETIIFEDDKKTALAVDPARATAVNGFAKKRKRGDVESEELQQEDNATRLPEIWTRQLQQSSSTAIVLLADEKSVQLVLKAIVKLHKTHKYPVWGESLADEVPPLGAPWVSSHLRLSRVDKAATKKAVHAFFDAFNRKEKEAVELAKRLRNEPDDDGFVTVVRGGRTAPASRNEAEEARRRMVEREAQKKSELKDFYRFQLRQRRKEEQVALVRRFHEDRKKVEAMREKRGKFKPET
jgi:ribosomal RNA-processing protein 7